MTISKTYLAVPYSEHKDAKKAGAQWDGTKKLWYAETPKLTPELQRWEPSRSNQSANLVADFGAFLKSNGVDLDRDPVVDGQWRRVSINGEKKPNASYRAFDDGGIPNGQLHIYKGDQTIAWRGNAPNLTPEQKEAVQAQAEHNRLVKTQELAQKRETAAKKAYGIWKNA
ncbi:hypothetical protein C0081_10990, partial [Cohaesibacter celericrescens]